MNSKTLVPPPAVSLFVKSILAFENDQPREKTVLPFYADGYPGIMFQQTENGLYVEPHHKKMPVFFLYGQTIAPIQLKMEGAYRLLVFQLYPFVIKNFFGVNPKDINDDCYDLSALNNDSVDEIIVQLQQATHLQSRVDILSAFLNSIFEKKQEQLDFKIQQAIQLIIDQKGQTTIKDLRDELRVSERTFERRFIAEVGITPKQFSKIIQFQLSLSTIAGHEYERLTDIVYSNGFADQSHFIRVFKAFTGGKTPKAFTIPRN